MSYPYSFPRMSALSSTADSETCFDTLPSFGDYFTCFMNGVLTVQADSRTFSVTSEPSGQFR